MSELLVRAALETQLATITPAIQTAYENQSFTPPSIDVPYQQVFVLFATPWNPEMGRGYQILGYMQVNLQYPLDAGPHDAMTRALAIRNAFPKNSGLTSGGVTTTIHKTPAIGNGNPDDGRWMLPIKIPFYANQFG